MDLAPFLAWYRSAGQGKGACPPRLMVGLAVYRCCQGVRSSRAVEMATWEDGGARVTGAGLHPDHATVARFVSRHEGPVRGLLGQPLVAGARRGRVSVDVVAGDGTKAKANASMAANATVGRLGIEIGALEALRAAEVEAWFAQARAADAAEDGVPGGGDGPAGGAGPGTPARVQNSRARAEAKAAAGRRKRPGGRVPVPAGRQVVVRRERAAAARAQQAPDQARAGPAAAGAPAKPPKASTTDPASGVMPAKKGGFGQLYNVQAPAGRHQVTYASTTHDNPADRGALPPLPGEGRANLRAAGISRPVGAALFGAGYASEDNFTTGCEAGPQVAVTRAARQTGRLPDGRKPATMKASWQQMAAKLDAPEGKALYRQRAGIIEPVFAQLPARLGRGLHHRGQRVSTELHPWAASHNLLKAIRAQARRAAATPAGAPAPA